MKNIKDQLTLKELLEAGATQLEKDSPIYEIGNQKYIVKDDIVIHFYYLDGSKLRKYEEQNGRR